MHGGDYIAGRKSSSLESSNRIKDYYQTNIYASKRNPISYLETPGKWVKRCEE